MVEQGVIQLLVYTNNHVDEAFHGHFVAKGANEAKEVNCKQHNINCPPTADEINQKEILTDSSANYRNSSQPHVTLTPQDKRIPEQRDVNRRVKISIYYMHVLSLSILFFFSLLYIIFFFRYYWELNRRLPTTSREKHVCDILVLGKLGDKYNEFSLFIRDLLFRDYWEEISGRLAATNREACMWRSGAQRLWRQVQGSLASLNMMIQYRNVQNICCIYMYIKIWAHSVMLVLFLHVHCYG